MTVALGGPTTYRSLTARPYYTALPRISGTERALIFTVAVYVCVYVQNIRQILSQLQSSHIRTQT